MNKMALAKEVFQPGAIPAYIGWKYPPWFQTEIMALFGRDVYTCTPIFRAPCAQCGWTVSSRRGYRHFMRREESRIKLILNIQE